MMASKRSKSHSSLNKNPQIALPYSSSLPNPKNPNSTKTRMAAAGSSTNATPIVNTSRKRGFQNAEDEDDLVIVNAFLDFKNQHGGSHPTPTTIAPLLDAIKGSLHHQLTSDDLYSKFRSLKNKYYRAANAGGPGPAPLDRAFYDVAVKVWGKKSADGDEKKAEVDVVHNDNGLFGEEDDEEDEDEEDDEEEEGSDDEEEEGSDDDDVENLDDKYASICKTFPYFTRAMKEYWEENGHSMVTLKMAFIKMDKEKAGTLEKNWKKLYVEELGIKAQVLKLQQKILEEIAAGYKSEED